MTTLFDQAHAWALKHPKRSANPDGSGTMTSWNSWCQSLAWRISDAFGHAANPSFDSALHAAQASGKLNKDWSKAQAGAFHYWGHGVGGEFGHVGIDLGRGGGGSWILMASSNITTVWGDDIGCVSWKQYQAAIGDPSGAKYLGWSMRNGTGYITVPKPVTPSKPAATLAPTVPAQQVPATPTEPSQPVNPIQEPIKPKEEPMPVATTKKAEPVAVIPTADLGVIIPSAKGRKLAYAGYMVLGLIIGNLGVGFAAANIGWPVWLTVAIAITNNLSVPFASLAIANAAPKK